MGVRMQAVILVAILHLLLNIVQQCHCSDNESDEENSLKEALLLLKILRTGTTPDSKSVAELISAFKASSVTPQDRLILPRPPENVSLVLDAFSHPSDAQPLVTPKENFRRSMGSNHGSNEIHKRPKIFNRDINYESRPLRRAAEIDYYESVPDKLPGIMEDYHVSRRKIRRRHRHPFYRRQYYDYYVHAQEPQRRLEYDYSLGSDSFRATSKDPPTTVTSIPTRTGKASKTTSSTSHTTTVSTKPKSVSKKRTAPSTSNNIKRQSKSVPIKRVAKGKSTPSPKVLAFHRKRNYKKPYRHHPNRRALEDTQSENATVEVTDDSTTAANTDITSTIMEQMKAKENQKEGQDPILSQVQSEIEQEMNGMQKTKDYFEMKLSSTQMTEYYPSTLRVHLAKSTRYPIPLPENHALCFLSPDNGLCRSGLDIGGPIVETTLFSLYPCRDCLHVKSISAAPVVLFTLIMILAIIKKY